MNLAGLKRVVLERCKREIAQAAVGLEIVDEASQPGSLAFGVGPHLDVFVHALEYGATEFQRRVQTVQRRRPLQVKGSVLFRQHVLAVRLLAHFDIGNRIASGFQVSDLGGGVLGCAVKHGDGNHCRESAGIAAGVEQVEADLVASSR